MVDRKIFAATVGGIFPIVLTPITSNARLATTNSWADLIML
jgi:hypothetical protein